MTRQEANRELSDILSYLVEKHKDLRFGQILLTYRFVKQERSAKPELRISWQDEFYMEPEEVLKRVRRALVDHGDIEES